MTQLPLDRRAFLLAALTAPAAAAAKEAHPPIIDTHQHLWDLAQLRLPWIEKGSFLDRSYLPADYQKEIAGLPIVQSVYLEVDVIEKQQQAEADAIVALCKKGDTPTRAAVISGRPASDGFARYIRPFKGSPYVRGVRQVLHVPSAPAGYCLAKPFIAGIRLLGELGLHFELCMRPADLPDAVKLVDACPDTRFVLDHCGNPDLKNHTQWKKDIAELAKRKNIVGKVSGIVASATPGKWSADDLAPVVNHTLSVFGPDRVMFGSDWPVCLKTATLAQWVQALRSIVGPRPFAERRKLFHDNAVRFYALKTSKG